MGRKIKNIIIYVIVSMIIIASFILPEVLLNLTNDNIQMGVYKKDRKRNNIDIEAKNIYLVQAIHDIESDNCFVKIGNYKEGEWQGVLTENNGKNTSVYYDVSSYELDISNVTTQEKLEVELRKLVEYDIVKDFEVSKESKKGLGITNKLYRKDKSEYVISIVNMEFQENSDRNYQFEVEAEVEAKTGKFLSIFLKKDNLHTECSKEEIMENYIKYLDLYIADDWRLENGKMKSEKAGLVVGMVETETDFGLSIHSSENEFNNYKYVMVSR